MSLNTQNTNPETESTEVALMQTDSVNNTEQQVDVVKELESINADIAEIKAYLFGAEETEETAKSEQKWTQEEKDFASQGYETLSSEAIDNATSYGLPFSLFGFSVVFAVLALIMSVVFVFGKIFGSASVKPAKEKAAPKKEEVKEETPVVAAPAVETVPVSDDKGIVAAIIAAISSFRASNGEAGGFRVVSFRKRK